MYVITVSEALVYRQLLNDSLQIAKAFPRDLLYRQQAPDTDPPNCIQAACSTTYSWDDGSGPLVGMSINDRADLCMY